MQNLAPQSNLMVSVEPERIVFRKLLRAFALLTLLPSAGGYAADSDPPRAGPAPLDAPAKGVFLVASRDMPDPRFQRSVIVILHHGEEGTLGVIVNRPTDVLLSEAMPELEGAGQDHALFFGGPVAMETLLFVARSETPPEQVAHVIEDVYWSGNRTALEEMLASGKPDSELRVYFGRAGWSPGQLDAELTDGSWHLFQADSETLFDQDPANLWPLFMEPGGQGWIMVKAGRIASRPVRNYH